MKQRTFLAEFGLSVIARYRYIVIFILVVGLVIGLSGLQFLKMDSSNESFFGKDDPLLQQNREFKELFGNEEFVFVMVDCGDVYQKESLEYLQTLSSAIEARVPFVKEALSINGVEYAWLQEDTLVVEDMVSSPAAMETRDLEELRRRMESKPMYTGLVSPDGRHAGIYVSFAEIPHQVYLPVPANFSPIDQASWSDDRILLSDRVFTNPDDAPGLLPVPDPRKLIPPAISAVLRAEADPRFPSKVIGVSILDFETDRIVSEEMSLFGLIALVVSGILLLVLYRRLAAFLIPMIVAASSLAILLGLMGYLGFPVNVTSILVPTLILVISVSYSIHFISHYLAHLEATGQREASLIHMLDSTAWPCLLAGLTTAIGFLSFLTVSIEPLRQIGIIASLGVGLTFILAYAVSIIAFSFGKPTMPPRVQTRKNSGLFDRLSSRLNAKVIANPGKVTVSFLVLCIILAVCALRITVQGDMLQMLGPRFQVVSDIEHVTERLGALYSCEIMVSLPEPDQAKDPAVLSALEDMAALVSEDPRVFKTFSMVDMVKDIKSTMEGPLPDGQAQGRLSGLPSTREETAQYLLVYEMSGGSSLNELVDYSFQNTHITVQLKSLLDASSMRVLNERIQEIAADRLPPGTKVSIIGDMALMMRMIENIVNGQIASVVLTFIIIALVMMVVLRSVPFGLLLMVPNIIPVFMVVGTMGLLGIRLDLLTMLISSIIIGIAVDNTIHFSINYQAFFRQSGDVDKALEQSAEKTHRPFWFSTIVLCVGFGMLGFSHMRSLTNFALLSLIAIISALLCDLSVTPALIKLLKPYKSRELRQGVLTDESTEA